MVQKTGIIVQKKNYTLRTWQTEDVASLAQYLNNKNIWDNCRDGLPYPYSQEDANVFLSMVPVSYTHLDVYKRQHHTFGKCRTGGSY